MTVTTCNMCGALLPPSDSSQRACKYCGAPQDTPEVPEGCIHLNDNAVAGFLRQRLVGVDSTYVHPSIPEKKLANARKVHAQHLPAQETILALYDGTAFGSATDGFVVTSKRIAWKNQMESAQFLEWSQVDEDEVWSEGNQIVIGRAKLDTLFGEDDDGLYVWNDVIQTLGRSGQPPEKRRQQAASGGSGPMLAGWGGPEVAVQAGGWGGMAGGFAMTAGPEPPEVERLPRAPYASTTSCSVVDVHPSGELVLACGSDSVELRSAGNGQRVGGFSAPDSVLCARFSADGNWLLVGALDGKVYLYETRSGTARGATPKMSDGVEDVVWLGASTWFAALGQRGELWLVDAMTMQPTARILDPDPEYANAGGVAASADGTRVFASIGSRIGAFDTASGKIVWRNDEALMNAARLAASPRGDLLVAAGYDGVALFDARSGQSGPRQRFQCARTLSWPEGSGGLFKKRDDDPMYSWTPHPRFSPTGDLVAVQDHVGNLCFYDVASGALHSTGRDVGRAFIEDLAWFRDGNHVLLGMSDNTVSIWRVRPFGGLMRSQAITNG